jgi:hypothetical protein
MMMMVFHASSCMRADALRCRMAPGWHLVPTGCMSACLAFPGDQQYDVAHSWWALSMICHGCWHVSVACDVALKRHVRCNLQISRSWRLNTVHCVKHQHLLLAAPVAAAQKPGLQRTAYGIQRAEKCLVVMTVMITSLARHACSKLPHLLCCRMCVTIVTCNTYASRCYHNQAVIIIIIELPDQAIASTRRCHKLKPITKQTAD